MPRLRAEHRDVKPQRVTGRLRVDPVSSKVRREGEHLRAELGGGAVRGLQVEQEAADEDRAHSGWSESVSVEGARRGGERVHTGQRC